MRESGGFWRVLCVLSLAFASLCADEAEYDGNYVDSFDNEISEEGETPATPCQAAELSRWDKLFVALEDSHMRQNMLLESVGQCCVGTASVRNQLEKLVKASLPRLESTCRAQAEQARALLQRGLAELSEEGAAREGGLNAALRELLQRHRQGAGSRAGARPTQPPSDPGRTTLLASVQEEEQDVATQPPRMAAMEKALVAIATELQKVHLQLANVIQQAGTFRESRGDM
ncbi:pentraxin-related protein PTX3-like isoform X2 [Nelusetta ayraudi]|uniref:pentraxin-related protein PTX3-like isoform X2 n=1 Tax=Nelusetta ayraudi TaxID=303726 RepID=UPI003F6E92DD